MDKYGNSSFWLDGWDMDTDVSELNSSKKKALDLYKMAASKRAISNFVNIVSNQNIPVTFNTSNNSYTDGKSVVIGSNISAPKDFDVAVGLSLHEGSHILLSDFSIIKKLSDMIKDDLISRARKINIPNPIGNFKNILNYIEDRRIDNFIYTKSPGYRTYYKAMYDKYFNDKLIDKALLSDEYTDETIESYMFRLINLHNSNSRLNALSGLVDIWNTIDLKNISRLNDTYGAFLIAEEVFEIIIASIENNAQSNQNQQFDDNQIQNGSGSNDSGSGSDSDSSDSDSSDSDSSDSSDSDSGSSDSSDSSDSDSGSSDSSDSSDSDSDSNDGKTDLAGDTSDNSPMSNQQNSMESTANSKNKLSDKQKSQLDKKINKQTDFMNGNISKKRLSKADQKSLTAIEDSNSEIKSVGADVGNNMGGVNIIVVNKLTKSLMESDIFPLSRYAPFSRPLSNQQNQNLINGIRIGNALGKKLQTRSEDRNTIYNRQKHGKIDKRMIYSAGFDNSNIFEYTEIDSYKKANLHISVDASGSMSGSKWNKTITTTIAICKAVDMIPNLSIQVSFRTTGQNSLPYVVLAYDSRVDSFTKVKQLFPLLDPNGYTPEGLVFESIQKLFIPSTNDMDSYFLNISDGEPYVHSNRYIYSGADAINHTKKMINLIKLSGIGVLSYFIDSYSYYSGRAFDNFKKMYGTSAKVIDTDSVIQITKTLNELFLKKA